LTRLTTRIVANSESAGMPSPEVKIARFDAAIFAPPDRLAVSGSLVLLCGCDVPLSEFEELRRKWHRPSTPKRMAIHEKSFA
jgi:hypothetical protein